MKTKLLIIALLFSVSSLVLACPGGKAKRQGGEGHLERMSSELNLTLEQSAQFAKVQENRMAKMKSAMESIHAESKTELSTFLSEEQMKMLEDNRQEKRGDRKKRRH